MIPEALWDHILNTVINRVAGKTRRLGTLGMLGGQIPTAYISHLCCLVLTPLPLLRQNVYLNSLKTCLTDSVGSNSTCTAIHMQLSFLNNFLYVR